MEKQRVAKAVIAILDRRMPGISKRIETIDVSTPASVVRFMSNWKSSIIQLLQALHDQAAMEVI
ncbi:hypothetical protein ACVDG8_000055 [Mesorhizobium sp. ORM8.1]